MRTSIVIILLLQATVVSCAVEPYSPPAQQPGSHPHQTQTAPGPISQPGPHSQEEAASGSVHQPDPHSHQTAPGSVSQPRPHLQQAAPGPVPQPRPYLPAPQSTSHPYQTQNAPGPISQPGPHSQEQAASSPGYQPDPHSQQTALSQPRPHLQQAAPGPGPEPRPYLPAQQSSSHPYQTQNAPGPISQPGPRPQEEAAPSPVYQPDPHYQTVPGPVPQRRPYSQQAASGPAGSPPRYSYSLKETKSELNRSLVTKNGRTTSRLHFGKLKKFMIRSAVYHVLGGSFVFFLATVLMMSNDGLPPAVEAFLARFDALHAAWGLSAAKARLAGLYRAGQLRLCEGAEDLLDALDLDWARLPAACGLAGVVGASLVRELVFRAGLQGGLARAAAKVALPPGQRLRARSPAFRAIAALAAAADTLLTNYHCAEGPSTGPDALGKWWLLFFAAQYGWFAAGTLGPIYHQYGLLVALVSNWAWHGLFRGILQIPRLIDI